MFNVILPELHKQVYDRYEGSRQPSRESSSPMPNNACSGRVGVCAIYKLVSGFGFFLHLKPCPRPPTRR